MILRPAIVPVLIREIRVIRGETGFGSGRGDASRSSPLRPCRGAFAGGRPIRWCRSPGFAQPPATGWHPLGGMKQLLARTAG